VDRFSKSYNILVITWKTEPKKEAPMKKSGIINPELARALATLGHTDLICIADAGLPIPDFVARIDLTLVLGIPAIADVLGALEAECIFQKKVFAEEARAKNKEFVAELDSLWPDIVGQEVSHEEFKKLVSKCRFVIRTGEFKPYANVILESSVPF
jgi:D-ribose pyranase